MTENHECPTPPTGLPGETWVCPYCGRSYFAMEDDFADVDFASFHWELDEDPWDNP